MGTWTFRPVKLGVSYGTRATMSCSIGFSSPKPSSSMM